MEKCWFDRDEKMYYIRVIVKNGFCYYLEDYFYEVKRFYCLLKF